MNTPLIANAHCFLQKTRPDLTQGTLWQESEHRIHALCCQLSTGALLWETQGASEHLCLARSCLKPIQALPLLAVWEEVGLDDAFLALACGSHSGSELHQQALRPALNALPPHTTLCCGSHPPIDAAEALALKTSGGAAMPLHHNCSGKHLGLLLAAQVQGLPLAGYDSLDHPLHHALQAWMQQTLGHPPRGWAMDGCGLPTPALSLLELGQLQAAWSRDPLSQRALAAWQRHPTLFAGKGRLDTLLIEASGGKLLCKSGAEGLLCLWNPAEDAVLVLRCDNGQAPVRDAALLALLPLLGWLPNPLPSSLEAFQASLPRSPYESKAWASWQLKTK